MGDIKGKLAVKSLLLLKKQNKSILKTLLSPVNVLYLGLLMLILFLPTKSDMASYLPFIIVITIAEVLFLVLYFINFKKSTSDILCVVYVFLIIWELLTKTGVANVVLVPLPENVFHVFLSEKKLILEGLWSSLKLLFIGVTVGLVLGLVLGLVVGYVARLRNAVIPIAQVLNAIPPLVYTPYVVAIMPSFWFASVSIIFLAVFWPTFISMSAKVGSIDKKIIDSAKSMNLTTAEIIFKVILPYSLPEIIMKLSQSITVAMICLTGAEMLGAKAGMGYFVKRFSDYADYTKVVAGIIFIGFVVTILNILIRQLQKKVIKWQY